MGVEIKQSVNTIHLSPISQSKQDIINHVEESIIAKNIDLLKDLHRSIVNCRWHQNDLNKFDYRSFEKLVACMYDSHGFSTDVKPKGPDKGLDILVQQSNIKKAIQVRVP